MKRPEKNHKPEEAEIVKKYTRTEKAIMDIILSKW
jgi:hypothetical protein